MSKATSETCIGNQNISVTPLLWVEYTLRWELTTILTSCLVKYFRHPSLSDKRNLRGRNCPLSRPRFQRMPSFTPWSRKATFNSIPPRAWQAAESCTQPGARPPLWDTAHNALLLKINISDVSPLIYNSRWWCPHVCRGQRSPKDIPRFFPPPSPAPTTTSDTVRAFSCEHLSPGPCRLQCGTRTLPT